MDRRKRSRRDFLNYGVAALASIGASSSIGYAASRAFHQTDPDAPNPTFSTLGRYGNLIDWPIIAIHAVLLPSGSVMSFGTDQSGNQGAFIHDVWNPELGTGPDSHFILPNGVTADFFCSAASLQSNGTVLIADGDLTVNGVRNYSNDASTIFNPRTGVLTSGPSTGVYRWYPSFVSLPNGEKAIFGGINTSFSNGVTSATASILPQITNAGKHWKSLNGAANSAAFDGSGYDNWFYPRANVLPGDKVGVITNDGLIFTIDTTGQGSITQVGETPFSGAYFYPTISYAPGKWLSIRFGQVVLKLVFGDDGVPTVTQVASLDQDRIWSNGTVLADGRVLVNGGSIKNNKLKGVAHQDTIWDPWTEEWTPGATAAKARLYHNSSLLLTDGTVLTAGGGAPGPLVNLNAQIYYPSYLFAPDGTPAVRPKLAISPKRALPGNVINGRVGRADTIYTVTALRMGATTHSYNSDAVFLILEFTQTGQDLSIQLPTDTSQLIPGYWMIFAWNYAIVPSLASVLHVTPPAGE
jgi:hypothetical protein